MTTEETSARGGAWRRIALLLAFVALAVALVVVGDLAALTPARLRGAVAGFGALAPIVYVVFAIVGAVLMLPGTLLMVAGALVFPLWLALPIVWIGMVAGAVVCFLLARYFGRDVVERRLRPRIGHLDDEIGRNGFRLVLLLRLVGIPPINVLNYAAGLTKVKLSHYVVATALGLLPYLAAVVTIVARIGSAPTPRQVLTDPVLWAAVTVVVVVMLVANRLRPRAERLVEGTDEQGSSEQGPS